MAKKTSTTNYRISDWLRSRDIEKRFGVSRQRVQQMRDEGKLGKENHGWIRIADGSYRYNPKVIADLAKKRKSK